MGISPVSRWKRSGPASTRSRVHQERGLLTGLTFHPGRPFALHLPEQVRHGLRHTFGTRLAEAGHSEAAIAELMGRAEPKTTRRYTHGTERAKRAVVEAASGRASEPGAWSRPELKAVTK